ncbi:MAG: type II secretion system F family protein [Candidatus Omnitrophota bacterium]
MPQFFYKALDKQGNEKDDVITALSYQDAVSKIKAFELYPIEIHQTPLTGQSREHLEESKSSLFNLLRPKVKTKHIVPFISDLAVLIDSGVSLAKSLTVLYNQTVSRRLKNIVGALRADVEGGQTFSEALSKHPRYFPPLCINMVRAGEIGGVLSEALERLAHIYEKNEQLDAKIKTAFVYPVCVLSFAFLVVICIMIFIVPQFLVIFEDVGSSLPPLTLVLFATSTFMKDQWILLIGVCIVFAGIFRVLLTIHHVRFYIDALKIRLPIFGILVTKMSISRFCRIFGTLLANGVPILRTLSVAKDATGNMVLEQAIEKVKNSIKEGESVSKPLSQYSYFPPIVTNMIAIGEETGTLSKMLIKISDRYEMDADILIARLTSLLGPFLIIGLGFIIGFIVIALFLPLPSVVQGLTGA